ncbi:BTAD domain-containing putative transcriptional regulator [Microlunatus ginsengisoli]|uniref:Adenylate/guanylate cyclase domain-containing protein n=1 Tax=Microlunatus ginsengisoli TaxID=363863 RepID=A0ABP6ZJW8_9ACTN
MFIQVLGPISADLGARQANLGGPKQRTVFALLALRANRSVGVEDLINEVWEDDPPGRPRKTLQVYVANLRRELGDGPAGAGGQRISSGAFGYRLRVADDELDLARYEAIVARARARAAAEPIAALRDLESALAVWSGSRALADLSGNPAVARLVRPLEEARADVVEELIGLQIRHGAAGAAAAALPDLIAADPWRERLWALLMQAYYVTGRQVDALDTYQRVRNLMIDELGVEPGPELRDLERRVLAQDPSLSVPTAPLDPAVPAPDADQLHANRPGAAQLGADRAAPDGGADERRTVTFVSFGLTDYERLLDELDPEDLADVQDELRARAEDVVAQHGGVVASATDEGVLAYFGYPNAAEDDPQQAVRAALTAAHAVPAAEQAGSGLSAGVHTGLTLFRGAPPRATGQAPRVTARLQRAAAAGEVLVSSDTAALIAADFALTPVGRAVALPSGLSAVAVGGELASAVEEHERVRLVGRDVELARLRALDAAVEPAVVVVLGEAGIGKSALATAYLAGLGAAHAGALIVRADRHRRSQALYPIGQLLAARYGSRAELELDLDLLGVPQPGLAETAAVLSDLAGWDPAPEQQPVLSVTARRAAVTTWLAALGDARPLRVVVEDLPYLDQETVAALEELVDQLNHGLLVVTSREDELPPRLAGGAHRIELGRLPADDARALVIQAAAPARLRLGTVNGIVELADGHPLHLRELARQAGAGPVGQRPEDVPATLNASLLARLDRLGPAKALVQRCAVIGDRFDVELAAVVCEGVDLGGELTEQLDALVAEGVLRRSGPPGRRDYTFAQGLLEDVAYASLPRAVRTELHQRIAARLAAAGAPAGAQLAEHLEAAGQVPQAAFGWVQAADAALRATRFAEAQQYARRALADIAQLPPGPETGQLLVMAKLLLATSIKMTVISDDELVETVLSAFVLVDAAPDLDLKIRFYPLLISTLQAIGRYAEAVQRGTEAIALAGRAGNPIGERRVRQFHAATLIWMGRLDEADAVYVPTDDAGSEGTELSLLLRAAELLSDCAGLALAGLAEHTRARADRSHELFERARVRAQSSNLADAICLVYATRGIALQLAGDATGTQQAAEATIELAVQLGNDWWFVWAQALLGWSVAAQGNPDEGLAIVLEAIEQAGDIRQLLPYFNALAAAAEVLAGRPEPALARIRDAIALTAETGEGFFLPYLHLVAVDALVASGAGDDEIALHRRIATDLAAEQGQRLFLDQVAGAH